MNYLRKKLKPPVTIIIGIKNKDGIALACDSRSMDVSGIIRDDARKLSVVTFQDGNQAVLAQAGNVDTASLAVEMITEKAKTRILNNARAGADLLQDVMEELKNQLRRQYVGTGEELQQHFDQYAFELMLAHYFSGKQYIFTADFVLGVPVKKDRDLVSIGCGWNLAEFLLAAMPLGKFELGHAMWSAIYAVEQIKLFDGRCGGPTQGAVVQIKDGKSKAIIATNAWLNRSVPEIVEFANEQRLLWTEKISAKILKLEEMKWAQRSLTAPKQPE